MDQKKKKLLNIPESKGLLHNFKFSTEIPFAPLSYPKTLYYQLDPERHTRARTFNAEVKNMCNLLVNCDLGLPIDDLNIKPHVYNLQGEEDSSAAGGSSQNPFQLHPDDLALINEDIIVSDTEEDEEIIKLREEQRIMEERIKEKAQQISKETKKEQKLQEKQIDFSHSFDTLRIAIHNTFTAATHTTLENLTHPTDPKRKPVQVFELFPSAQVINQAPSTKNNTGNLKQGVISHKQRIEAMNSSVEKGKFCCLYKDMSFQDKNQKMLRLFLEKPSSAKSGKAKTVFEEDQIQVNEEYVNLFEDDPEVQIEDAENNALTEDQIKLKNKSMFTYTDHSSKLQANDMLVFFEKNCEEQLQKAAYQKIEFQYSIDQEKKELTMNPNARNEVPRYVTMEIVDEEKLKATKMIAEEDEEDDEDDYDSENNTHRLNSAKKPQDSAKNSIKKPEEKRKVTSSKLARNKLDEEDDEDEDFDDYDSPKEQKKFQPSKSYNLRDSKKSTEAPPVVAAPSAPAPSGRLLQDDDDESLDDIFGDDDEDAKIKPSNAPAAAINNGVKAAATAPAAVNPTSSKMDEEEEDDEEEFHFSNIKARQQETPVKSQQPSVKKNVVRDDFINDGEDDEEDEDSQSDESSASDHRQKQKHTNNQNNNTNNNSNNNNNNNNSKAQQNSYTNSAKKRRNVNDSSSDDQSGEDPEEFPL